MPASAKPSKGTAKRERAASKRAQANGSFTPQSMPEISIDAGFVENIEALIFNGITSSIGR